MPFVPPWKRDDQENYALHHPELLVSCLHRLCLNQLGWLQTNRWLHPHRPVQQQREISHPPNAAGNCNKVGTAESETQKFLAQPETQRSTCRHAVGEKHLEQPRPHQKPSTRQKTVGCPLPQRKLIFARKIKIWSHFGIKLSIFYDFLISFFFHILFTTFYNDLTDKPKLHVISFSFWSLGQTFNHFRHVSVSIARDDFFIFQIFFNQTVRIFLCRSIFDFSVWLKLYFVSSNVIFVVNGLRKQGEKLQKMILWGKEAF